jgi:hypothetical protein
LGLIALLVVLPWFLYVALGNLFLNAGGVGLILGGTREVTVHYRFAYTLWFGRVHLRNFHFTFQDANVQFAIDLERASVRLALTELPSRTFHATQLRGDGASFRMRHRLQPDAAHVPWVKALAPIPEFSDPPLFEATVPAPPVPESEYRLWTVHLEDVDVGISELWVQFIRYRGEGRATGAFRLRPARHLWVGPAALELANGHLTLGDDEILRNLRGRITCTAHPFDVRVPVGLAVLRHISSHIELHGTGLEFDPLPRWFSQSPELGMATGPSKLDVSLDFFHGRARAGSNISIESDWLELALARGTLRASALRAESRVLEDGGAETALLAREGAFRMKGSTLRPLEFKEASLGAHIERADSADPPSRADRRFSVRRVHIPDARWLNDALALRGVAFTGGSLTGHASLQEHRQRVNGAASLDINAVALSSGGVRLVSDGHVDAKLNDVSTHSATGRAHVEARFPRTRLESAESEGGGAKAQVDDLSVKATVARPQPGKLKVTLGAEAAEVRANSGDLQVRARPKIDLSAAGEPLDQNLHAELALKEISATTTAKDSDCPWFKSPLTTLKLALSEDTMELAARIASLDFGWGDFSAHADTEIETLVRGRNDETTPASLAFAVRNRRVHLTSGQRDTNGWEARAPKLDTSGEITLSTKHPGHVSIEIPKLTGRIGGTHVASRVRTYMKLAELDLDRKHARFSADVRLGPVEVDSGTEKVRDWWAHIALGSGLVTAGTNLDLSAMFQAHLRDATPALAVLEERDAVPDLIARNLKLEKLEVTGIVQRRCRLTDFLITQASGGPLSARGRLHSTTDATRAALLLRVNGLEAISAGVALSPRGTDITPFAGDGWLREQRDAIDAAASRVLKGPCLPTPGTCGESADGRLAERSLSDDAE